MQTQRFVRRKAAVALAAAIALPALVQAQPLPAGSGYLSLSPAMLTDDNGAGNEADVTALVTGLGYAVFDGIAIEGRLGFGIGDDTVANGSTVELDNLYGVYLVGHLPLAETISLYAQGGVARAERTVSSNGMSLSTDAEGLSWAAGAAFQLSPALAIGVEYTQVLDESEMDLSGYSASVTLKF